MAQVFGDRWKVVKSVGEGGQAHTFQVRDQRDGSASWILKKLKNRNRLSRFEREIEALKSLHCPNIPQVEDYSIKEPAFLVVPYLGTDLSRYTSSYRLDTVQSLLFFRQITSAVRDAHSANMVHRDIKPNNIVVSHDGATVYLIDFGLCQYFSGTLNHLTTEEAFGHSAFAAPECLLGREEEPGTPCDIYSLGKLFYWMISNGSHINRENLTPLVLSRIAPGDPLIRFYLSRLVRGTLKEAPTQRWTAEQLLHEVDVTLSLVRRVSQFMDKGLVMVEDNFGVDDSFDMGSSRSATTAPRGNPPGDQDLGTPFDVSLKGDVELDTVSLAISKRAGDGGIELKLVPDAEGKPHSEDVLEFFRLNAPLQPSRVLVKSLARPILRRGTRYWLLLSTSGKGSEVAFWGAPLEFMPRPAFLAQRRDGLDWKVAESKTGPGYAFRVTGKLLAAEMNLL